MVQATQPSGKPTPPVLFMYGERHMEPLTDIISWTGPDHDQSTLLAMEHGTFGADWPEDGSVTLLREVQPDCTVTGRIVGVEIDDFLRFENWRDIPDCPKRWKTVDDPPARLTDLLRRVQMRLRSTHSTNATAPR